MELTLQELSNLKEFADSLRDLPRERQLAVIKPFLARIHDDQKREYQENLILIWLQQGVSTKGRVVVLIHGIRTHAVWQNIIENELGNQPDIKKVYSIGYQYFDLFQFLFSPHTDKKQEERIKREIRMIKTDYPVDDLIVIAHSFGTYLSSKILAKEPDIRFSRLLLCGSIIPSSYRWDTLPGNKPEIIVNDCGSVDKWPLLAGMINTNFGCSGTFGFKTMHVTDRWHNIGHSDFFTRDFIRRYWLPFVLSDKIVESEWTTNRPTPPWTYSFMSRLGPITTLMLISIICTTIFYSIRFISSLF